MALGGIVPKLCLINTFSRVRYFHKTSYNQKLVQFILSDIGEGIREVTVRDWFVKVGDKVSQFDDICLVESDKASVNITSRYDGTVMKLYHQVGDTAFVGRALVDIDVPDDAALPPSKDTKEEKVAEDTKEKKAAKVAEDAAVNPALAVESRTRSLATPATRRMAMENNIDLKTISGTGKGGRVLKEDIFQHLSKTTSPYIDAGNLASSLSPPTIITLTGVKKAMAKSMTLSNSIPSFGYCDEINVTKLVKLRAEIEDYSKKHGNNITYIPFILKAISKALNDFPHLNARVDEKCEKMTIIPEHNIGVAIDTPDGLIVPNIKNVQRMSLTEISAELKKLIEKAKSRKLSIADLTGGTFTVSNIGVLGGTYVKPLINPPEVCIVGIGKFRKKPIYNESDELIKAHMCNVSWTADHRVIDGATMARFANLWRDFMENPSILTLDL